MIIRQASEEAELIKRRESSLTLEINKVQASIISEQKSQVLKAKEIAVKKRIDAAVD